VRYLALALLLSLSGCGQPKAIVYSWGKVIRADPSSVNEACGTEGTWDSGQSKRFGEQHAGCWKPEERELWLRWDNAGLRAIFHELCHVDGKHDCEGYEWP
jgi:hypothetical protein